MPASARFQAHADGLVGGDFPVDFAWSSFLAIGTRQEGTLPAGDSLFITYPGTTLVIIVPPATNTNPIVMKGTNPGDVGIALAPHRPTILSVKPIPPAVSVTVRLTLTTAIDGVVVYFI
jgi:hypothetical protein